jgi:hypothetical protein
MVPLFLLLIILCGAQQPISPSTTPSRTVSPSPTPSSQPAAPAVGLSPAELSVTRGFAEAFSSLSFTGSLFILFCYLRYKTLRKFSFTLIALLSFTDVLNQTFDFLGPSASEVAAMEAGAPTTARCLTQALGNAVFELSSVLWTGCIAWTLYALVWLGWRPDAVERALPRMFGVALGVPVLLMLLPFTAGGGVYGPAGAWCAIRASYPGFTFVCFYVPLWCTMAFNAFVHLRTLKRLKSLTGSSASNAASGVDGATADKLGKVMERLKFYPFILLIVWGPASINRLVEAIWGRPFGPLFFLHRVCSSSQGLLNALLYGFSRGVREKVAEDLHALWPSRFPAPPVGAALGVGATPAAAEAAPTTPAPPLEDAAAARGGVALLAAAAGGAVDTAALAPRPSTQQQQQQQQQQQLPQLQQQRQQQEAEDVDVFVDVPRKE